MFVNGQTVSLMLLTHSVHAITSVLHNNSLRLSSSSSWWWPLSSSPFSSSSSFPFYRQLFPTVWLFTASHSAQNAATERTITTFERIQYTFMVWFASRRQFERYYTIMAITRPRCRSIVRASRMRYATVAGLWWCRNRRWMQILVGLWNRQWIIYVLSEIFMRMQD